MIAGSGGEAPAPIARTGRPLAVLVSGGHLEEFAFHTRAALREETTPAD